MADNHIKTMFEAMVAILEAGGDESDPTFQVLGKGIAQWAAENAVEQMKREEEKPMEKIGFTP